MSEWMCPKLPHVKDVGTALLVSTANAAVGSQRTQNYKETTSHRCYTKKQEWFLCAPVVNQIKWSDWLSGLIWTGMYVFCKPLFLEKLFQYTALVFIAHHSRVVTTYLEQMSGRREKIFFLKLKVNKSKSIFFFSPFIFKMDGCLIVDKGVLIAVPTGCR